jgi:hypothetical protein
MISIILECGDLSPLWFAVEPLFFVAQWGGSMK